MYIDKNEKKKKTIKRTVMIIAMITVDYSIQNNERFNMSSLMKKMIQVLYNPMSDCYKYSSYEQYIREIMANAFISTWLIGTMFV